MTGYGLRCGRCGRYTEAEAGVNKPKTHSVPKTHENSTRHRGNMHILFCDCWDTKAHRKKLLKAFCTRPITKQKNANGTQII